MKIISKFKDYYDYKVAEYGTDENLVYDRRLPAGVGVGTPQRSWITLDDASFCHTFEGVYSLGFC